MNHSVRQRVRVIANSRSGTVLARGVEAFTADVIRAFEVAGWEVEVRLAEGEGVARAVSEALSLSDRRVVVAGGDGTLMRLLPVICHAKRPIGLLPLGTVNLLGKDLGFTGNLSEDAALSTGEHTRRISLAQAGSTLFHSNAGLGILGRMAFEREEARRRFPFSRGLGFLWAATRTLFLAATLPVSIEIDGIVRHYEADAVLVTNNAFDDTTLRRPALDKRLLEVHIVTAASLRERLAFAFAIMRGRWRTHPNLKTLRCSALRLERRGWRRTRLAIDGELLTRQGPIALRATRHSIEVYARPPEQTA